jgi:hypothetical protein
MSKRSQVKFVRREKKREEPDGLGMYVCRYLAQRASIFIVSALGLKMSVCLIVVHDNDDGQKG